MVALLLAAALAAPPSAEMRIGAGVSATAGLGEVGPSPFVLLRYSAPGVEAEATFDASDKYTRAGWIGAASVDARAGALLAGLRYSVRDAGDWRKQRLWLRAGAVVGPLRVLASTAATSRDRESEVEVRATVPVAGRFSVEVTSLVVLYDQGGARPDRLLGHALQLCAVWRL